MLKWLNNSLLDPSAKVKKGLANVKCRSETTRVHTLLKWFQQNKFGRENIQLNYKHSTCRQVPHLLLTWKCVYSVTALREKDLTIFCQLKYASKTCVSYLIYTTSEWQCHQTGEYELFYLRLWRDFFCSFFFLMCGRRTWHHNQAGLCEGQKVHTPSTLALNRFSETSPVHQRYLVWR